MDLGFLATCLPAGRLVRCSEAAQRVIYPSRSPFGRASRDTIIFIAQFFPLVKFFWMEMEMGTLPIKMGEMGTLPKQSKFSDKRIACICFKVFPYHSSTTHQSRTSMSISQYIYSTTFSLCQWGFWNFLLPSRNFLLLLYQISARLIPYLNTLFCWGEGVNQNKIFTTFVAIATKVVNIIIRTEE